jgi:hypothetical protein
MRRSSRIAITLLIATQFPGTDGLDLPAFSGSSALLVVVMLVASAIPAIRAARTDPVAILKVN